MSFLYPQFLSFLFIVFWLYSKKSRYTYLYVSFVLVVISLARPVLINSKLDHKIDAKELIIALDVSYSMRADDIQPSRLQKAKELIKTMILQNKNEQFSLFAFTTNALILSPPTTDHKLVLASLNSLNVDNILTKGTNFENLFKKIEALNTKTKNVLLLSDGGDVSKNIKILKDMHIYVVAMATKKGSPIKIDKENFLKDMDGNLVISRLNPNLKVLAQRSGGKFFNLNDFDMNLEFLNKSMKYHKKVTGYEELFAIPLILSCAIFLLYFIKIPKKLLFLFGFLSIKLHAGLIDWFYIYKATNFYHEARYSDAIDYFGKIEHKTIQSQMDLANSYYQAKKYKQASLIYLSLETKSERLKYIIYFKLANCYVKLKEYSLAKRYYQKALSIKRDKNILHNLQLIMFLQDKKQKRDIPAFKKGVDDKKDTAHKKQKSKNSKKGANKSKNQHGDKTSESSKSSSSKKGKNIKNYNQLTHPLGYKAYEKINKGYISEKKPW